jgi:hypothetical protein
MASSELCALAMCSISTDVMEAIRRTWETDANLRVINYSRTTKGSCNTSTLPVGQQSSQ